MKSNCISFSTEELILAAESDRHDDTCEPEPNGPHDFEFPVHNPALPCDVQGGHDWHKVPGKNVNEVPLTLEFCRLCGKVRA